MMPSATQMPISVQALPPPNAALGGEVWPGIAMCILLGGIYLALGSVLMQNFERLARQRATLSLT